MDYLNGLFGADYSTPANDNTNGNSFLTDLGQLATTGLGIYGAAKKAIASPTGAPVAPGNPTAISQTSIILWVVGGVAALGFFFLLARKA